MGFCVARTKNGSGKRIDVAAHRAGVLLHGLKQGGLRLGRSAVDFVGEDDVAEDRPFDECPLAMAGGQVLFDDVGSRDVGRHQVGRELDAAELQAQRIGNRAHHQCLRGAGHAGDKAMAADKQRDQHLLQHILLADDHLAHLLHDSFAHCVEAIDALLEFNCILCSIRRLKPSGSFLVSWSWAMVPAVRATAFAPGDSRARFRARPARSPGPCLFCPRQDTPGPV